jgi:hypothetical protein
MPFVAMAPAVTGTIASSSEYNKVVANVNQLNTTRTKYKMARATGSSSAVSTSVADLPGATVNVTTVETNTEVKVTAVFDIESTNTDIFVGTLVVNGGAAQNGEAHYTGAGGRATVTQQWTVTLPTAATHTLKLRTQKVGALGTMNIYGVHSCILVEGQGIT